MSRRGRALRPAVAATLAAAAAATVLVATGPASVASPADLARARAEAARLAAELEDLEQRTAIAAEDYAAVAARLDRAVSRALLADERTDVVAAEVEAQERALAQRVSALYRAGSELSLYATVLEGGSPQDVVSRVRMVQDIVGTDRRELGASRAVLVAARSEEADLEARLRHRQRLERRAERAHARMQRLVAERQARLDAVSARVRTLAAEERARAQAAAEAQAASVLSAAGVGVLGDRPPGNPYAAAAVAAATAQVGDPYVWAATGPDAFDCSGLTQWAYRQAGLSILRTSRQQWYEGPHVAVADLAPGDLLFWARDTSDPRTIHHVAMYVGAGKMVEAPYTGASVRVVPVRLGAGYIGATRPGLGG